jgi:hypothetical protein
LRRQLLEGLLQIVKGLDLASLVLGAVISGLVGFIGTFINGRIIRRRATASAAITACTNLRFLLGEWLDGIKEAVTVGKDPSDTIEKLQRFREAHNFQERLYSAIQELRKEPVCNDLCRLAYVFEERALERKGKLAMELERPEFFRGAYDQHRGEALGILERELENFKDEMDRVVPLLQKKAGRLAGWAAPEVFRRSPWRVLQNRTFQWSVGIFVASFFGFLAWKNNTFKSAVDNLQIQEIRGGAGVNIADLKAGRDVNISINQRLQDGVTRSVGEGPFIYAEPVEFILYKPSNPQAPGQEKVWIKIKLTNQSDAHYAYNVHVNFLTDDGTGHKTNSDNWNAQMGTKSLYTFNSIAPLKEEYAVWKPDVPANSEHLYKTGKANFKLAIHVSWRDREGKEHASLSQSELRYNRELDVFLFEVRGIYNSLHHKEKINTLLSELLK